MTAKLMLDQAAFDAALAKCNDPTVGPGVALQELQALRAAAQMVAPATMNSWNTCCPSDLEGFEREIHRANVVLEHGARMAINRYAAIQEKCKNDPFAVPLSDYMEAGQAAEDARDYLVAREYSFGQPLTRTLVGAVVGGVAALTVTTVFGVASGGWFMLAAIVLGGLLARYSPDVLSRIAKGRWAQFNITLPSLNFGRK